MKVNNCFLNGALVLVFLQQTSSAYIRCYRGSLTDYEVAPLETSESLLSTSCYNRSYLSIFYTFGYRGKDDGRATTAALNALFKLIDTNIMLLDWEREASSIEFLGIPGILASYVLSALSNAKITGNRFGEALNRMSAQGLNLANTHLIAHSLGAQVFGYGGRLLKNMGKPVARITGLDPAGPFFDRPPIFTPLGRDSADFVASIHTDSGGYGMNTSYATVDIYVNYQYFITGATAEQVQPGCPVGDFEMFTIQDLCSHDRSWMLLVDALEFPNTLLASKAPNYYAWVAEEGNSNETIAFGVDIDTLATGNYYMSTNSQSPFGKGLDGLSP